MQESESSTQVDDKSEYPIPSIQLYSTPLIPSITIIPPTPPKKNRQRRFLKRTKFRKKQKKDLSGNFSNNLTTNFSSLPIEGTAKERVLNKGLNFCPAPEKVNKTEIKAGFEQMRRSILWAEVFAENVDSENEENSVQPVTDIIRVKKTNLPKSKPSKGIKKFLATTEEAMMSVPLKPHHSNLPEADLEALKELNLLQKQRKITIKPNDKDGGQSIMDTPDYIEKMEKHLSATVIDKNGIEKKYYEHSGPIEVTRDFGLIQNFLEKSAEEGIISAKDKVNLLPEEPKESRLYGMPKTHKTIKEGDIVPDMRPVVAGSGSNTENISLAIDKEAKTMVPKLDSYWQDTPHALRDIEKENYKGPQPPNTIPVTMDVVGMYNNIEHQEGMDCFREALNSSKFRPNPILPTEFLMTLLLFVLTMNVFVFNGSHYHQLWGTAMGTRVAPTYACIFMGFLEIAMLGAWTGTKLRMYRRYIDDVFFLWDGTEEELKEFIQHCNSFHHSIKFTFEYSFETKSVNFLDMIIWIDCAGFIQTDLFKKAGRKNQCLLPSTAQPKQTTKRIPLSLNYRSSL